MFQASARGVMAMMLGLAALGAGCAGGAPEESAEEAAEVAGPQGGASDEASVDLDLGEQAESSDTSIPTDDIAVDDARDTAVPVEPKAAPSADAALTASGKTLRVSGRRVVDTCGQPFVARGMEQLAGKNFSADGKVASMAQELIKTKSNAVRLLPQIRELTATDIDGLLRAFAAAKVVVYISPGDRSWFKRDDIKPVLLRHEKGIILDAFQEPNYNDRARWLREAKASIAELRAAGFSAPLTVIANHYGRDLQSVLQHGQEIVDSDPEKNTILGWQAYWGTNDYYQRSQGLTLTQGIEESAAKSFPIQAGIDLYADPGLQMNYREVMAASQRHGIGWLWWNFWNRWDSMGNNASRDGTISGLTTAGEIVVNTDTNSIAKTARKACFL